MVEILVRATGNKKGHIIYMKDSPCVWGSKERLPAFIILAVTVANLSDVRNFWAEQIRNDFEFSLSGNRVTVVAASVTATGENSIPVQKVRDFLLNVVHAENIMHTSDSVSFGLPADADIPALRREFIDKLVTIYSRRRYYFDHNKIDQAVAANMSRVELTKQQTLALLHDKMDE